MFMFTSSSLIASMLALFLLASCVMNVQAQVGGTPGEQSRGNNTNFPNVWEIPDGGATFRCFDDGARCTITGDFAEKDINYNDIQETANPQQLPIAAFLKSGVGTLVIDACEGPDCTVICNFGCTCTLDNGSNCTEATLAPTPSPTRMPTEPPTVIQCPVTENYSRSACRELLTEVVNGTESCDCYNFCDGKFTSCCKSSTRLENPGQCGVTTCRDGGVPVQGCTLADLPSSARSGSSSDATMTVTTVAMAISVALVGMTTLLWAM